MKNIVITREKSFSGALVKYYCVLNMSKENFQQHVGLQESLSLGFKSQFLSESSQIFPIANGKSISIEISERVNTLFAVAFTSSGRVFSDELTVEADDFGSTYSIKTKMGFTANKLILKKV